MGLALAHIAATVALHGAAVAEPEAQPAPRVEPLHTPEEIAAALAAAVAAHLEPTPDGEQAAKPPLPDLRPLKFSWDPPFSRPDAVPYSRVPPTGFLAPPAAVAEAPGPTAVTGTLQAAEPPAAKAKAAPAGGAEFIMPFERGRVTSMFNQGRYHPAIDLAGPLGTPVHATTRGQRVIFTGRRGGYGNLVVTRDASGRQHFYAHLQRITARVGTVLEQGQMLGNLGSTGRSTGPHVHYEVRLGGIRHVDPATLLFPGRRVGRGFAWNGSRSIVRVAAAR